MATAAGVDPPPDVLDRLAGLPADRRLLLERRIAARGVAPTVRIPRRTAGVAPSPSEAQRRLLVLDEAFGGGLTAYNAGQAVLLDGQVDLDALRTASDDLVARHDVLRSRFTVDPGGVHLDFGGPAASDFAVQDITEAEIAEFVRAAVSTPFDLAAGRLYRVRVGRLDQHRHVVVVVTHHIVSDAGSKAILNAELARLYVARRDGVVAPLEPVVVDYADYAAWQATRTDLEAEVAWWGRELRGVPDEMQLPADRPRPPHPDYAGAKYGSRLDTELVAAATAQAQHSRTTLFAVLLAAFSSLLHRYNDEDDVVVGSPFSSRNLPELAEVVGMFLDTLPIRIDTSGDPTFAEMVRRTKTAVEGAFAHQDVSFEQIVDVVRPTRVPGRNPVFQTLFTMRPDSDRAGLTLDGTLATPVGFDGGWTKTDLSVICRPVGAEVAVLWQYATSRFDDDTIRRLDAQYHRLLRRALARPDVALSALALADEDDVSSIASWNATEHPIECDLVHEMIEAQARSTPGAAAVGDESGWLTFADLDRRANQLAHVLVGLGVGPDVPVAIYLERTVWLEVAILAVLKAGGAYVPLDTDYPRDRVDYMLRDSGAIAVLTSHDLAGSAPAHDRPVVVDSIDLSAQPQTRPDTAVEGRHLAYILYTSGSTGRPKGVQLEHRAVANQLEWLRATISLSSDDTVVQKTPISFDVAGWEVLLAPASGARLFMARAGGHLDPDYLIDTIRRHDVTFVNFVPSMLALFLERPAASACTSLRAIVAAGEALPDALADECARVLPGARLSNIYGPTETAIGITHDVCTPDAAVTIGRPCWNSAALVLDNDLAHQPIGMPGELWLGGAQLARGYRGRPDLTAERFVDTEYGRLYRTGDRVAWHPSGRLVFLGRLDDQVKLRGFRVELDEIASVLSTHEAVRDASVVVTDGPEPALSAFVTLSADAAFDERTNDDDHLRSVAAEWDERYLDDTPDPTFNTVGWTDPLTGRAYAEREMREWLANTVERISSLRPSSILDIGVGSGLLLWRLAPRVDVYDAVDLSEVAIARLTDQTEHFADATFRRQAAHEVTAARPGQRYDCVVLNSVAQDFPGIDYLGRVMARARSLTSPTGAVFVGDVRDARLADAATLAALLARRPGASDAELRLEIDRARTRESNLLVHPTAFTQLPGAHVQVMPRRGHAPTEMNRFRYDVVVHESVDVAAEVPDWLDWSQVRDLDRLRAILHSRDGRALGIRGIPNARTSALLTRLQALDASGRRSEAADVGIDPEELFALARPAGYRLELSCARSPATVDAAFTTSGQPVHFPGPPPTTRIANDPVSGRAAAARHDRIVAELSTRAAARLPAYMVPASIRVITSMPVAPSGKLDRRGLASIGLTAATTSVTAAPRTETERRLALLWQDALNLSTPVSIDASFFDLGGSSLLAIRLFPRIEAEFHVKIALASLFENVTVASLAAVIDSAQQDERSWDLLVSIRDSGFKRPLFLMPVQRGDVLAYRQLVDSLDPDRPVYGIQCVGLDGTHSPRMTIEDIAADCVTSLRRVQPSGPYLLAGYCFGGVVAFEVGRQLLDLGEQVDFVGLIDSTPYGRGTELMRKLRPSLRSRFVWRSREELDDKIRYVMALSRRRSQRLATRLHAKPSADADAATLDVHAANRHASRIYRTPTAPLAVQVFRAGVGDAERDAVCKQRWELVATGGVNMHVVAGYRMTHHQIVRATHAPRVAAAMNDCLDHLA